MENNERTVENEVIKHFGLQNAIQRPLLGSHPKQNGLQINTEFGERFRPYKTEKIQLAR